MIGYAIILFVSAFVGGLIHLILPRGKRDGDSFRLSLVFAGAYLFGITIIHLLPDLYTSAFPLFWTGFYVLVGFFLQQVLEYFTSGIEHGHLHVHHPDHQHSKTTAFTILVALSIHAFLEGTLLANPVNGSHTTNNLLLGILLHKAPAAFALMSVILCHHFKQRQALVLLTIFAMASPAGLVLSYFGVEQQWISDEVFTIFFALVSGSFLHISTTIVFESSPKHTFNFKKLAAGVAGAGAAVLFGWLAG